MSFQRDRNNFAINLSLLRFVVFQNGFFSQRVLRNVLEKVHEMQMYEINKNQNSKNVLEKNVMCFFKSVQ